MEISYIFRFADYDALSAALWTRRARLIRYTIFWLAVAANAFIASEIWLRGGISAAWPNLSFAIILLLFWFPGIRLVRRWNLRRLNLEGQTIRIKLSEESVFSSQNGIESHLQWSAFTRYSRLGNHAFLWINKLQALVIPFDAFKDVASRNAFLDFIATKISPER